MTSRYEAVPTKGDRSPSQGAAEEAGQPELHTPTAAQSASRSRALYVTQLAAVCGCWLACSSGIIIVNRYIMRELEFAYPMALSALGVMVSYFFAFLVCDVFQQVPPVDTIDNRFFLSRIAPLGAAQGIAIWLSNQLYLLLTVAFIEMARSMLPLVTLLALWAARVEIPTGEHIRAVSLTGVGCALSAYGELALSSLGLLCLGINFAIEAARLVMLQFLMQGHNMHPWQSLKLMSLPAGFTLVIMSWVLEADTMREKRAMSIVTSHPAHFVAAGTLGVAVNLLSNIIIKMSSATTIKLLAAVRGPMVVLSGVLMFSESVMPIQFIGYSIALMGFVWYNVAKARHAGHPRPTQKA